MQFCRPAVLAILLYLVLDLCLASMPGAFVFNVEDSVETVQRQRPPDLDTSVRAVVRDPRDVVTVSQHVARQRAVAMIAPVRPWMPLRTGADHSSTAPAFSPPSEDSH